MYCKQALLAILLLSGCRQVITQPQRTAVLRFENLGAADADWQGRALSELLKRRFAADRMPRSATPAPGISTERLADINAGANRLITGYYTASNGLLDVTAFAEDALTQKLSDPLHVTASLRSVTDAIAQHFGGAAGSAPNADSPAIREYALASDTAGAAATPHYELAIQADPNFAPAYLGLAQSDPARAKQTVAAAMLHAASFGKEDRAYLQLESAALARDNRGRVDALAAVAELNGNDPGALRALGDAEMATRKPADAAQHYRRAIALAPNDPNLRNLLAYAALYAGDEAGARAAAAEYRRLAPQDPNTLDTAGDVELAFGHFAEAEKDYAATPWKAARARLMAGGTQAKGVASGYRAAEWLYLTGHKAEGTAAMAAFAEQVNQPVLRSAAYAQSALWAARAHDDAHATQWSNFALQPVQRSTALIAALARFLAQPAASADTMFGGSSAVEVRRLAVGLRLLQSRKFAEAVPVWKEIYENTNATEAAPAYLYAWALLETGHKTEAAQLLKLNPIPSESVAPTLEAFYYPELFEWRKASLRQ